MSLGLGVGSLFSVFHRLFRLASNKVSYVKHNYVCVCGWWGVGCYVSWNVSFAGLRSLV